MNFTPGFSADNFVPLPTELKVSSVAVSIRAPLGFRYRPGEAFPLELHVDNPGPAMDGEWVAVEGGADGNEWGERTMVPGAMALTPGKSRFLLPMRAPGVSASITLVLRGGVNGGAKAELFRASLSRVLKPLPSDGRIILVCGGGVAPKGPQDQAARLTASELPAEGWIWESVDWVVLNDAAIKDSAPEAKAALRRWLVGGGRIFLGSREAFSAALNADLLPLATNGVIGSDWNWWEANAGLTNADGWRRRIFGRFTRGCGRGLGRLFFCFRDRMRRMRMARRCSIARTCSGIASCYPTRAFSPSGSTRLRRGRRACRAGGW